MNNSKSKIIRQLTLSIAVVIVFSISLCITTFALIDATVSVEKNYFKTGTVGIDLNNGESIINDYLFEPGMTVEKTFYIKNTGTGDVYYKIYMDKVEGDLADVLEITVLNGETVLYEGKASKMKSGNVKVDKILVVGESRDLTIRFHYPENSQNNSQNLQLTFNLCAEAVQAKNNHDKEFN